MSIHFDEFKQNQRIKELRQKEEEDLAQMLSQRYSIPYVDLTGTSIDTNALRLIPEDEARNAKVAAFGLTHKNLNLAILTPARDEIKNAIADLERRGYRVTPHIASTQSLERAWSRYKDISFATESKSGSLDIANDQIEDFINKVQTIDDAKKLIEEVMQMKKSFRISRIVEIVVAAGIGTKASDVHIEPEDEQVRLRFRLDGVLTDIAFFDLESYRLLVSRIKLLSRLKINIKTEAQNGRFSVKIGDKEIEIRTSTLPGNNGESVVMRLLDPSSLAIPLPDLGFPKKLLDVLLREIDKPNGMILNTGPTGSGKTTTLYAFLNRKKSPDIKIITIEDPIEYHLTNVVQTQVDQKKNYDFASGLKNSLRQDPDVIMVGEIRDSDTADTAVQAALTGHLVFSTLHTNNAAGAFPRLINLGVNPKILTSAVSVVIAQRLVRKVCDKCKKEIKLEGENLNLLKAIYDDIVDPDKPPFPDKIYEAVGCEECNGVGYHGRLGIFEAILTDKAVEKVVQANPSDREIKEAARSQGIMDMVEDGVMKIISGVTTIEEVSRVVDLKNRETLD